MASYPRARAQRNTPDSEPGSTALLPAPTTVAEWDQRYPGVLDGVGLAEGAANVIMQLALPGVGRGVLESRVESGNLFRHPVKRARTTLTFLGVAMLGSPEEKQAYRQAINSAHRQVYSTETSPVEYHAMNPQLQLWVAACLAWGLADTWQKFRGPVDRATLNQLYQDLAIMGTTLQVKPAMWPQDIDAFERYWEDGLNRLTIDPEVRALLDAITDLGFLAPPLRWLFGPLNRFLTTGFLPEQIRCQMQWSWTAAQQRRFERLVSWIGFSQRLLPRMVRTGGLQLVMWDFRRRLRCNRALV